MEKGWAWMIFGGGKLIVRPVFPLLSLSLLHSLTDQVDFLFRFFFSFDARNRLSHDSSHPTALAVPSRPSNGTHPYPIDTLQNLDMDNRPHGHHRLVRV